MFRAHFTDGENLGDKNRLADLAAEVGLDRNLAAAALESDDFQSEVRADKQLQQIWEFGECHSSCWEANTRRVGAQPLEMFTDALDKAYREANPLVMVNDSDSSDGM